jgi:uncharacterized membrane protein
MSPPSFSDFRAVPVSPWPVIGCYVRSFNLLIRRTTRNDPMTDPSASTDLIAGTAERPFGRVESIDLVRGLVMILMVLDHVRDYFGNGRLNPTDLQSTTPALFFTRWVTHFCAPTFMLLAGVSASLSGTRRTRGELSRHLLTRGLWLIFLEQTWGNVTMFFTYPHVVLALVLWAIGWSMIALAGLIYVPRLAIGAIGVAMIALHNLLDGVQPGGGIPSLIWSLLHARGFQFLPGRIPILVGYPLIPWIGVMALGYSLGPVFLRPSAQRRPVLLTLGLSCIAGFLAIRGLNIYGDPNPWIEQDSPLFTIMAFLNCQKYPPSLSYLLMTLGPAFVALAAFDRGIGPLGRLLSVFGRVPLFFYLLQWPVAHGLAVAMAAVRGYSVAWLFMFPPFKSPEGYGNNLAIIYLFWIITVALLYYPSLWWADLRRRKNQAQIASGIK